MPRWIANHWMGDSTKEDRRLAILHNEIQMIEGHAQYLGPEKDYITKHLIVAGMQTHDLKKYRRVPFEALPCHRDIVVEIQGEEWVLEKEKEHEKRVLEKEKEDEKWASRPYAEWQAFLAAKREHQKKKKEAYYRLLRGI